MPRPELHASQGLSGRRVLITRSADRARPLASLLGSLGATPLVLPLIDFERAEDQASLDDALDRLAAGDFDWLVLSSVTTVRVLLEKAARHGKSLADLVPAETKVATIGPSSRDVLESVGLTVALAPAEVQSAEGLLAAWKPGPVRVLLPQADIAAPGLREGLATKGAVVATVVAYQTVDYPARTGRKLEAQLPAAVVDSETGQVPILTPEDALAALEAGTLDAVVAASPSAARRIAEMFPSLGACRLIAIGRPTAAEVSRLGLTVAATAKEPTPDGIVAALESVFANEGNPQ
ncbi:uroporphyrinogen-III synthase [Arthrobacter sp. AK01]|uniref:uroporphyrinogen-III synthase n=1 Tax=Arthrobacter sp. AK01 TaxID=2894084 RepID=UPI001E4989D5|nr:uroporphyrinogen-III synthase [Arthrobacter sp. AK01]MCD4849221.1 uroporphyrinogen-III synthase [Arthrobacter sp. AK01]